MFTKRVLSGSNKVSSNNFETCSELLNKIETPKILIVGGGTIGAGSHDIVDNFSNGIISFDIYYSDNIDFIADAHSIPLKNETIDLVIIQAVLEHVIYPNIVVNECHRVLKVGGYIYAETPFLQHVHEGAYDFTRYTVLGHRILFEQFDEFKSGFIGGLGQSLLWSIDFFVSGVFRNRVAGKIVKGCFFWLRWIEKVIPNSWNIDGACGSYFIGQKTTNKHKIKLNNVLIQYKGAQQ
jgi:SAM-dependent methyltransferase